MDKLYQKALPPIAHHKGSKNWSELSIDQQNELIVSFFQDEKKYYELVMKYDWNSEQHVGLIQTIGLIERVLHNADALEVEASADVSRANKRLLIETLINTQFGRRIAQLFYINYRGQSYDFTDFELEYMADNFIEIMQKCDEYIELEIYDVAIDTVLEILKPVEEDDKVSFPPDAIVDLWDNDEEIDPESAEIVRKLEHEYYQRGNRPDESRPAESEYALKRLFRFPGEIILNHDDMLTAVKSKTATLRADHAFSLKAARNGFPVSPFATIFSLLMPLAILASIPVGWQFGWLAGAGCIVFAVISFRTERNMTTTSMLRSAYKDPEKYKALNEACAVWVRKL